MNKIVTSKEDIILQSKGIIQEKGVAALTIRSVAKRCGVSIGSIYNYFPSKEALVEAAVQAVWVEIIHLSGRPQSPMNFKETLSWLLDGIKKGRRRYPEFFDYQSMGFLPRSSESEDATMTAFFQRIYRPLYQSLIQDPHIDLTIFDADFKPQGFVKFIFQACMDCILRSAFEEKYIFLMIDKLLYRS